MYVSIFVILLQLLEIASRTPVVVILIYLSLLQISGFVLDEKVAAKYFKICLIL